MKTSQKIALAAAVVCLGGLMVYRRGDSPPAPTDGRADRSVEAAPSTVVTEATATATERIAATPTEFVEPWLSHPYQLELEILVLDPLGLPIASYKPELAPPGGTLRDAADATDDNGRVVVRWAARQPSLEIEVLDPRRHRRLVTVRHGVRTQMTLLEAARTGQDVLFRTYLSANAIAATRPKLPNAMTSGSLQVGLHPYAVFSERGIVGMAENSDSPEQHIVGRVDTSFTISSRSLSSGTFTLSGNDVQRLRLASVIGGEPEEEPAADGVVEGTVYGEDGKPAADTPVVLLGSSPQPLQRGKTDEHGRFRFEKLTADGFHVRAGGEAAGLAEVPVQAGVGVAQVTLQLRRDACIRGTLRDAKGEPIAEATIEWHAADGNWADRTTTQSDGTFLLANLPSAPGRLFAWAKDGNHVFPIAVEDGVLPDTGEVQLVAAIDAASALQLQPLIPDGLGANRPSLRVRQLETGFSRAISVPRVKTKTVDGEGKERTGMIDVPTNPWRLEHLPAGNYEVDVWLPGSGRLGLGQHWLDGKSTADLGNIALPQPGRLRFDVPKDTECPEDFVIEITSLRPTFDVRIETLDDLEHELLLAPGGYALACRQGDRTVHFVRFSIESSKSTFVPVVW